MSFDDGSGDEGCMINTAVMPYSAWHDYTLVMVLMQYAIPLVIISATYGHMASVSMRATFDLLLRIPPLL